MRASEDRSGQPHRPASEGGVSLVELLVVIALIGVIGIATTSVVISTQRTSHFTQDMRTVMDDGRIILDRMRQELRAAKRVLDADPVDPATGEGGRWIRFWLDEAQDDELSASEVICYAVREIVGRPGRYEVVRWGNAPAQCDPIPTDAHVIARTLVDRDGVFVARPHPVPGNPNADRTRLVAVSMRLDVRTDAGPREFTVETSVRLRNVR